MQLKQNDIDYLEKMQRDYENTIAYYQDLSEHMQSWNEAMKTNEHFLTLTGLTNDIKKIEADEINKITENFIFYIMHYFEKSYGLSTLTNFIQSKIGEKYVKYRFTKYNNENLHYRDIIKDICTELKIEDLDDATIDNLRKRVVESTQWFFKSDRLIISESKIKITDGGFYTDFNWNNTQCGITEKCKIIFIDIATALNYKNSGKLEISNGFKEVLNVLCPNSYNMKLPTNEFFNTYEVGSLGVKSFRLYKNRNTEIKFINNKYRDRFISVMKGEF